MRKILIFLLLLTIPFISAESICVPNTDRVCLDAKEINGYLYCDESDFKVCSEGCVISYKNDYCNNWFRELITKIKELLIKPFKK